MGGAYSEYRQNCRQKIVIKSGGRAKKKLGQKRRKKAEQADRQNRRRNVDRIEEET